MRLNFGSALRVVAIPVPVMRELAWIMYGAAADESKEVVPPMVAQSKSKFTCTTNMLMKASQNVSSETLSQISSSCFVGIVPKNGILVTPPGFFVAAQVEGSITDVAAVSHSFGIRLSLAPNKESQGAADNLDAVLRTLRVDLEEASSTPTAKSKATIAAATRDISVLQKLLKVLPVTRLREFCRATVQ